MTACVILYPIKHVLLFFNCFISVAEQLTNRCLLSTGFALVYVDRFIHLLPFIKEQSMFIRVNRIFNSAFQISITQT